jgi:hypothetical protein
MLAYLFPEGKITVSRAGDVTVAGVLVPYQGRITAFIRELGLTQAIIRYRAKRFYFSGSIDTSTRQRLRNFFAAECPTTR